MTCQGNIHEKGERQPAGLWMIKIKAKQDRLLVVQTGQEDSTNRMKPMYVKGKRPTNSFLAKNDQNLLLCHHSKLT